jgi:hypothetical protein
MYRWYAADMQMPGTPGNKSCNADCLSGEALY